MQFFFRFKIIAQRSNIWATNAFRSVRSMLGVTDICGRASYNYIAYRQQLKQWIAILHVSENSLFCPVVRQIHLPSL